MLYSFFICLFVCLHIWFQGNAIYARVDILKDRVTVSPFERRKTPKPNFAKYTTRYTYCSPVLITSSHNLLLYIEISQRSFGNTPQFRVYFRAVGKSLRDSLHVVHTSPVSGYVQPVGLVPGTLYGYALYSNATYRLVPQDRQTVMTSLHQMQLSTFPPCSTKLSLFSESTSEGEKLLWKRCNGHEITPEVYNTSLVIRFQGHSADSGRGFKLFYTFHSWSQSPQKLPNGMFNCSVLYYQDFKVHMHCNLQQECEGREDEGGHCPFSSSACNGSLATKNKCIHLHGKVE